MNKAVLLYKLDDIKGCLMKLDANYRGDSRKNTPQEIDDVLKAVRLLSRIVEAGGFDDHLEGVKRG